MKTFAKNFVCCCIALFSVSKTQAMKKIILFLAIMQCHFATYAQSPHAAQLYGTTQVGGPEHLGSIFHLTPSTQTVTIDHNFQKKYKGKNPKCEIVAPGNGKYYGTTSAGGANNAGVIFSWDSVANDYNEIYNFTTTDGMDPRGGMIHYNGKLYGMCDSGGVNNMGTIYEWDIATNTFTKRIDLDSLGGKNPVGSLTLVDTVFYGFTNSGGIHNKGVLFTWNPVTNVYIKKFDFDSISGSNPVGKLVPFNGKLYAMCNAGGSFNWGTVYEWNYITNAVIKKIDFNFTNGATPMGFLTLYNNKFYGMTYEGGIYDVGPFDHGGVIFEWNPTTNGYTKKKDLLKSTGTNQITGGSYASLILVGNVFYGNTTDGVIPRGTLFRWDPATNLFTDLFANSFTNYYYNMCEEWKAPFGNDPYGTLLLSGNNLIGATASFGGQGSGVLFDYSIDSNQVLRSVHMEAPDGKYPRAALTKVGKKLYGTTPYGGNDHAGNIFEWDYTTQTYTDKFLLNGTKTGINVKGELTLLNGKLYGAATYGKVKYNSGYATYMYRDYGTIFSWEPASNTYQELYVDSNSGNYAFPPITFTALNNKLYTAIPIGWGKVMQFDPGNNSFDTVASMNSGSFGNIQDMTTCNPITVHNGKLYGMAPSRIANGGDNFKGLIYEWDTTANIVTDKVYLTDSIGTYPSGALVWADSVFYGLTIGTMTGPGITSGFFRWNPATNQTTTLGYGQSGTPTYSGGKIYFYGQGVAPVITEYDPVLNTFNYYNLPTFPENGQAWNGYAWYYQGICPEMPYSKLIEVIPNIAPILQTSPIAQNTCTNSVDLTTFIITDADMDTMNFQITSSNPTLLPPSNISITNMDSLYTLSYFAIANQSGTATISIVANDGYGDSVVFSFAINIISLPVTSVTQAGTTLTAQQTGATYQWINCNNNTAIAGATNQSYTATTNGNYSVVITGANGCSDTSACTAITTVGIDETHLENNISISPNPVKDYLNIRIADQQNFKIEKLIIKNMLGETVYVNEKNFLKNNITQLAHGVYTVQIITGKGNWIGKFVKQ